MSLLDFFKRKKVEENNIEVIDEKLVDILTDTSFWDDRDYLNAEAGVITHGHGLNVSTFTEEEKLAMKEYLKKEGVDVVERQATSETRHIKEGESYFAVKDPRSITSLRGRVFSWAQRFDSSGIARGIVDKAPEQSVHSGSFAYRIQNDR